MGAFLNIWIDGLNTGPPKAVFTAINKLAKPLWKHTTHRTLCHRRLESDPMWRIFHKKHSCYPPWFFFCACWDWPGWLQHACTALRYSFSLSALSCVSHAFNERSDFRCLFLRMRVIESWRGFGVYFLCGYTSSPCRCLSASERNLTHHGLRSI